MSIEIKATSRPTVDCSGDKILVEQHHAEACNVNNIIKKYKKTGIITHLNKLEAKYGDVTGLDFQNAQNLILSATEMFGNLPSSIRKEFNNDPAVFLDFCDNPNNREQLIEWGLASRDETDEATRAEQERAAKQTETVPVDAAARSET